MEAGLLRHSFELQRLTPDALAPRCSVDRLLELSSSNDVRRCRWPGRSESTPWGAPPAGLIVAAGLGGIVLQAPLEPGPAGPWARDVPTLVDTVICRPAPCREGQPDGSRCVGNTH
ncbi:Hypothetical protein A7982_03623 [Minicystis rosea]|nr:Hypothetical protein A7982_03623 [Minicystis rosea]